MLRNLKIKVFVLRINITHHISLFNRNYRYFFVILCGFVKYLRNQLKPIKHLYILLIISTCGIGISMYPKDGTDDQTLVQKADQALYHSKKNGKNNY
ncbi:MAG: diguanylate cyclase, partial [Christensenellaceae bacterium]